MKDEATIISPDTIRQNRVPSGQRVTNGWPTLHYGEVPRIDTSQWRFRIFGQVEKERRLSFDEFMALPKVKVLSDVHCVTTWSRLDNLWEGVSTSVLKDLVEIRPEARFAIIHASSGFSTNISLEDFFQEDVLFAIKHDGKIITPDHGYPVRLVVPRLYFWKSAKWLKKSSLQKRIGRVSGSLTDIITMEILGPRRGMGDPLEHNLFIS